MNAITKEHNNHQNSKENIKLRPLIEKDRKFVIALLTFNNRLFSLESKADTNWQQHRFEKYLTDYNYNNHISFKNIISGKMAVTYKEEIIGIAGIEGLKGFEGLEKLGFVPTKDLRLTLMIDNNHTGKGFGQIIFLKLLRMIGENLKNSSIKLPLHLAVVAESKNCPTYKMVNKIIARYPDFSRESEFKWLEYNSDNEKEKQFGAQIVGKITINNLVKDMLCD